MTHTPDGNNGLYLISFGIGQVFENHYVVIEAISMLMAREIMFRAFGNNWSMAYDYDDEGAAELRDQWGYRCLCTIIQTPDGIIVKQEDDHE